MKIAFISPEVYPFAKTGGLADVSYAIPVALAGRGHDVVIILPLYKSVNKERYDLKFKYWDLSVPFNKENNNAPVYETLHLPGIKTWFIESEYFQGSNGQNRDAYTLYSDDPVCFAFFSKAVIELLIKSEFKPDIIHCNDWHTGLVPVYKKIYYQNNDSLRETVTVMTVHNAGYQGIFPKEFLQSIDFNRNIFNADGIECNNKINFLKGGVLYSDIVTTVSKKYSLEIQKEEFGHNLAGIFRGIRDRLYGIPNAIDKEHWNPSIDNYLEENYSAYNITGKSKCKRKLQRHFEISENIDVPIIGSISRLTYQKGIDVLAETLDYLFQDDDFQFILIGSGDYGLFKQYERLKKIYPDRVGIFFGYNEELAHTIYAGIDLFIMPSRYEPCGLGQMYSLCYGAIPVVRATGGLDDIIEDWDPYSKRGNGFKFKRLTIDDIYSTLRKALRIFHKRSEWNSIQRNAMSFNYTWDEAIVNYEEVYRKALSGISIKK